MTRWNGPSILCLLLCGAGCGQSTSYWTQQIKSPDAATRLHAVIALRERMRETRVVVPVLTEALKDEDPFVRRDAARALGKFGAKADDAIPALRALLSDREPGVRKAAARSLKQINPDALADAS